MIWKGRKFHAEASEDSNPKTKELSVLAAKALT
jgi:hypothetical protein